jgi:hypothetical protein
MGSTPGDHGYVGRLMERPRGGSPWSTPIQIVHPTSSLRFAVINLTCPLLLRQDLHRSRTLWSLTLTKRVSEARDICVLSSRSSLSFPFFTSSFLSQRCWIDVHGRRSMNLMMAWKTIHSHDTQLVHLASTRYYTRTF